MTMMLKRERIQATIAGKPVDRVPVGFWRHWPGDDQRADTLTQVTLDFQRQYDLDFIKLPVSSAYTVSDYGVKHEYRGSLIGDRAYLERIIKKVEVWDHIQPLDVHKGTYGWHLEALRSILKQKEPETPVIVTMFNPLSIAAYLAGDEIFLAHVRSYPERIVPAINALTETSARFAQAAVDEGADGIFLSTRFASYEMMGEEEYRRFGRPGDLSVLKAASDGWFNVLHLHGPQPMFTQLADYPVQVVNWHDRTTPVNLDKAREIFRGALMAGIEQYTLLHFGSPAEVEAQVHDAIRQMNGQKLIVAPGCTFPIDVPHANLLAMRRAVETANVRKKAQ